MKGIEVRSFDSPDEVRTFDEGKLELVKINGRTVGRATSEPGWQWSKSLGPIVKTESCEATANSFSPVIATNLLGCR